MTLRLRFTVCQLSKVTFMRVRVCRLPNILYKKDHKNVEFLPKYSATL